MAAETSQTLDRGLRALELIAASPSGLTVTELAVALGLPRTVVYRLLTTLAQHRLIGRSADGRVRIGLAVLGLARAVAPILREAALPALRRLAEDIGVTAHLTVVDSGEALALAVVEPSWTDFHVAYRVGSRHPLDRGAAGVAILAGRGDSAARRLRNGFVGSVGELQPGAYGIAAPVLDVAGVEASVGVVALSELDPAVVGPRVVAAAAEVTAALNGRGTSR